MRADAFGPAAVTGLAEQAPRRSLHRGDATGAALASTAGTEVRRLRAGLRDKARRALSPPVLGSRCGVNCCAIQHNGLLPPTAALARKLARCGSASLRCAPFGWAATPVMSCAHSAPAAWPAGYSSPRSNTGARAVTACAVTAMTIARRAARAERGRAPPPTRPVSRGGVVPLTRHSLPAASARPPVRPRQAGAPRRPNSQTPAAMRCKPRSRPAPHSASVFLFARVKTRAAFAARPKPRP
jgi:hypothetical protein